MLKFIRWICRAHANNMFIRFWSWRRKAKVHARDEGSILENGYEATLSVWKWHYWIISRVGEVETIFFGEQGKAFEIVEITENNLGGTFRWKINFSVFENGIFHFFVNF